MTKLKNSNGDKAQTQILIKLKISNSNKTQLKLRPNAKTQIVTKLNSYCDKTQNSNNNKTDHREGSATNRATPSSFSTLTD